MPLSGEVTFQKNYKRTFEGGFTMTGVLQRSTAYQLSISGVLGFAGDLTTAVSSINLGGTLQFLGGVSFLKNGEPVGGVKGIIEVGRAGVSLIRSMLRVG